MKIFKRKHFQALIYSIFLSLPLLSVLGRCVYTIANKNAYQSYYGETINEKEEKYISDTDNFNSETTYYMTNSSFNNSYGSVVIFVDNLEYLNGQFTTLTLNETDTYRFRYDNGATNLAIDKLNDNNQFAFYFNCGLTQIWEFSFNLLGVNNTDYYSCIYSYVYNNYSYLDNAFEYSIDRFVSENDYGEMDFFTWFSSLFLSGNSLDSLYIHFINWYMNYILYVSLGYLIFSVLLWFVNFFRRLVEDSSNINVGGM